MSKLTSSQFLRFIIANSLAAFINITTKLATSFALNDLLSVLVGFCAGLSTSYLLCRNYVFKPTTGSRMSEIAKFIGVNVACLGLTYGIYRQMLVVLRETIHLDTSQPNTQLLAHTIGVGAPVIVSFIAQKTLTFRQRLN